MRRFLDACSTALLALLAGWARRPDAGLDMGSRDGPEVDDLSVW